jgi:hypothetical protein
MEGICKMPQGYGEHKTGFKDLTGKTIGFWTVIKRGPTKATRIYWLCSCVCGNVKHVSGVHLSNGHSTNCGCSRPRGLNSSRYKHGLSKKHPLYQTWEGMKSRCRNMSSYGGKGISVCERWDTSFEAFLSDMGDKPSSDHSIDRIDNSKGYSPDNCRWATNADQSRNKSTNRIIEFRGVTKPLVDWAHEIGINYGTLKTRLNKGMPVSDAFSKPVRRLRA